MAKEETKWVYVDLLKFPEKGSIKLFGSVTRMAEEGVYTTRSDGKISKISYGWLQEKLSQTGYWRTNRHLIIDCKVLKSKRKKPKNK